MEQRSERAYVIRHWCPVDFRDMPALEGWLTDLASQQGLYFARAKTLGWMFTRHPPQPVRYRLEPVRGRKDRDPDPERVSYYRACGWEYCGAIQRYYHVYLARDPETPELYDDPVSQSYALETLERRQLREALLYLVFLVIYPILLLGIGWSVSEWPVLSALESVTTLQLPQIFVYLLLFLQTFHAFRRVHRLRRMLRAGVPMEHTASPRALRRSRRYAGAAVAVCVLAVLLCVSSGQSWWYGTPESLTSTGRAPAWVSLAELEPDGGPLKESRAEGRRTPLLRSYEVRQSMDTLTTPAGARYTPGLTYDYYDPLFPFLAGPLMDDLIYRYTQHHYFPGELSVQTLDLPSFDRAVLAVYTDGFGQKLFLSRDGDVLYLCYFGWTDVLEHLESIEKLFDS